ncbi:Hypothetical protein LUCI_3157 [Lucifera butyrica]|uniref:Uncharacterized protein n=1 Tax=Lucifera butyrica TaxID=1351585 RepID=A0A498RCD7_9FIRM|nr:hypothetical protein [Lucifera butyrica]VBB07892.1 Hypothetical protein LUCI_3157 [Lucifera butyrica]
MTNEEFQRQVLEKFEQNDKFQKSAMEQLSALAQQLVAFQQFTLEQFDKLDKKITAVDKKVELVDQKATKSLLNIENELRPAIKALAEGQAAQQAQLDRIEAKVTIYDEIIFKRVK